MTAQISMNLAQLAAELEAAATTLPKSRLLDMLSGGAAESALEKTPVDWPAGLEKGLILRALAKKPIAQATAFGLDKPEQHFLLPYKKNGLLLLLNSLDEDIRLHAPADPIDVFAAFAELLQPTEAAPSLNVDWEFGQEALVALFAIVDRLKLLQAASLLERRGFEAITFDLDSLLEQIRSGAETPDYRWLCAYLPGLFPGFKPLAITKVAAGCDQLAKSDLVLNIGARSKPVYMPSNILMTLAHEFFNPLPALLFHQAPTRDNPAGKKAMLFSGRTIWHLSCGKRKSTLRCIEGISVLGILQEELHTVAIKDEVGEGVESTRELPPEKIVEPVAQRSQKERQSTSSTSQSTVSDNSTNTKQKFCTECGAPLKPTQKFCTSCGKQADAGFA